MLHHVGIEVAPTEIERSVELWQLLDFVRVKPPTMLTEFVWLERNGTQIHLMPTDSPTVPPRGHVAVVVEGFEDVLSALAEHGFEVEGRQEHWGIPRALVLAPGGHRIEIMSGPPAGTGTGACQDAQPFA